MDKNRLFLQAIGKFLLGVIVIGLLLFLSAGSLQYWQGWLLMGILFVPMFCSGLVMMVKNPELLRKRLNVREEEKEQQAVVKLSGLLYVASFVVAGLNWRFGWCVLPDWVVWASAGLFLICYLLYAEVLRENTYLSRTIEVQENQKVIDTGLYGVVRHPMYMATTVLFLAMPLVLASPLSFLIMLLYIPLIIKRINNEERVLEEGLEGYREYKQKVKYKVIPFEGIFKAISRNMNKHMNTKKLIVFLLFAFLPMIAVGLFMHYSGASAEEAAADAASGDPLTAIKRLVMSAGSMLIPLLAVIFTQLIFREPVLKGLGISFKLNRWWWIGWLLMPVIAMMVLGVTLLMPGANWTPEGEMARQSMQGMPERTSVWGFIGITLLSGLFAGITLNAVFAFGEEIAWRGFLVNEFKGKKFLSATLLIGVIWGFWHAPLILNGHNYPQHPVAGVFMMVILCVLLSLMLLYFKKKSGSVIVPAIMHGTINAVSGITAIVVSPDNDLLYGAAGLAGMLVLLMVDACLYLYDRYISKENLFMAPL